MMTPQQLRVINPTHSFWVTASAGSGKTKVLTDRILRLLLEGAPSHKLLCLTFTKKAALEMQERLVRTLKRWSNQPHDSIARDVVALDMEIQAPTIAYAQTLYDHCIKNPLTIQTFHSFCHDLLNRFPLESHGGFPVRVLDDRQSLFLWTQTIQEGIYGIDPRSPIGEALLRIADKTPRVGDVLEELFQSRLVKKKYPPPPFCEFPPPLSVDLLCLELNAKDREIWETLNRLSRFSPEYIHLLMTKDEQPRARVFKNASLQEWCRQEQSIVGDYLSYQGHLDAYAYQQDLEALFSFLLPLYEQKKEGALDFDDLTLKALALFEDPNSLGWVSYTLHQTLDHFLIDEAQDTSTHQWQILRHVCEAVLVNPHKTLFIVGDPKQSIYSFQGADIETAFTMKIFIAAWINAHGGRFEEVSLTTSFRSCRSILTAVNHVFKKSHLTHEAFPEHIGYLSAEGSVAWIPSLTDENELVSYWSATITRWISHPFYLHTQQRTLRASDIMILLPRRTSLYHSFQQALCAQGLLQEGSLVLATNQALTVLVMMGRWLGDPHDDEALALVMRDYFSMGSVSMVFPLAYQRGETSLWTQLRRKADTCSFLSLMYSELKSWQDRLSYERPFDVLSFILSQLKGIERLSAFFGSAGKRSAESFVSSFAQWQDKEDLSGFLQAIENKTFSFPSPPAQGISLMTIHGAKGLQSPVVVLPDLPPPLKKETPEYWRLLYVAMTRAQEHLYLSSRKEDKGWYTAIDSTMRTLGQQEENVYRLGCAPVTESLQEPQTPCPYVLPEWLSARQDTPVVHPPLIPFQSIESISKRCLGKLLHQLLDELPIVAPQERVTKALEFLELQGVEPSQSLGWAQKIAGLISRADLYPLFFNSYSEVELVVGPEVRRIDRMVVTPDHIWIVDFKSNTFVPRQWEECPYKDQIEHYQDLVSAIYPNRRICTGILWLSSGWMQWAPGSSGFVQ
jgi:ATP-dependent helicase/nuclease subunit A